MKKVFACILAVLCCCSVIATPVAATDINVDMISVSTSRIELPDGGYIIEEVTQTPAISRATSYTSGAKTSTRYTSDNQALFAVKVTGSFGYNGSLSWSTSSTATVYIYDSGVTYKSKSASYRSNYATATGTVEYLSMTISRTATLYCDKNGNLS